MTKDLKDLKVKELQIMLEERGISSDGKKAQLIARLKSSSSQSENDDAKNDPKKEIYFHIGLPKTGTTSIQHYCKDNMSQLTKDGLHYVQSYRCENNQCDNQKCRGKPKHGDLTRILRNVDVNNLPNYKAKIFEPIREEVAKTDSEKFLISAEGLHGLVDAGENMESILRKEFELLQDSFSCKIICYVREPFEYLKSKYNSRSRKSPHAGLFIDYVIKHSNQTSQLDLSSSINFYSKIIGSENVIVKLFDKKAGNSLREDFFETIGIDHKEKIRFLQKNKSPNSSELMEIRHRLIEKSNVNKKTKDKLFFGKSSISNKEWKRFLHALKVANINNKKLFKKYFGMKLEDIQLPKLILHERKVNRDPLIEFFNNSAK